MAYNAALAMLITGVGLMAAARRRHRLALFCACWPILIALLTAIQHYFDVNLGIDELFAKVFFPTRTAYPGRLAQNTGLCLFLAGSALAVLSSAARFKGRILLVCILSAIVLAISNLALVGVFAGMIDSYGRGLFTRMAPHTAAGTLALAIGLIALIFDQTKGQHSILNLRRTVLGYAVLGTFVVALVSSTLAILPFYSRLHEARSQNLQQMTVARAGALEQYLAQAKSHARQISRRRYALLAAFNRGEISQPEFSANLTEVFTQIIQDLPEIAGIARLGPTGKALLAVGQSIPAELLTPVSSPTPNVTVTGPVAIGPEFFVLLSTPVLNDDTQQLGTDLVLVKFSGISGILSGVLSEANVPAAGDRTLLGLPNGAQVKLLALSVGPLGVQVAPVEAERDEAAIMQQALHQERGGIRVRHDVGPVVVMAYAPVKGSPWGMVTAYTIDELYFGVSRQLLIVIIGIFLLMLCGTGLVFLLVRPLTGQMLLHTDELEQQIQAQTKSLATELAERRLAEEALRQAHDQLERRVQERTAELSASNLALQQEIAERKQAEQQLRSSEESLRRSEEHLRKFIERCPVSVAMFDREMRYLAVSNRWLEDYNLGQQELRGRNHYDVFPEISGRWKEIHRRCLAGGVGRAEADLFRRADGSVNWLRWEICPWRDRRGEIGGIIIASEDITARVQTAAILAGQKQVLELIAANAPLTQVLEEIACFIERESGETLCAITLLEPREQSLSWAAAPNVPAALKQQSPYFPVSPGHDAGGDAVCRDELVVGDVATNPCWEPSCEPSLSFGVQASSFTRIRGTQGEILGTFALNFTTPRQPTSYELQLMEAFAALVGIAVERRREQDALETRVVERTHELAQTNLSLRAEVAVRKQTEKQLRQSQEQLAAAQELAHLGSWHWDIASNSVIWSEELYRIFGLQSGEFIPNFENYLSRVHPDERVRVRQVVEKSLQSHQPFRMEERIVRPDGNLRVIESRGEVKTNAQGQPLAMAGICLDITELKQAEEALRARNEELRIATKKARTADRLKSAFLATMSHELRTPLNAILGFTGIILQGLAGPLTAEQQTQLGMVHSSGQHLLALINDVLDLSKIEAGEMKVSLAPCDLRVSIEKIAATVQPLAAQKGLALRVSVAPTIGTFTSDQRRVEQILLNLLNNAIKFTAQGEVALSAEADGTWVRLRIADTGIGIKPEDLSTLFKPFHQLDTGTARQFEGTGLGLAICQRLAGLLGGNIQVESTWGQGSVFTLTLPQ